MVEKKSPVAAVKAGEKKTSVEAVKATVSAKKADEVKQAPKAAEKTEEKAAVKTAAVKKPAEKKAAGCFSPQLYVFLIVPLLEGLF